MIDQMNEQIRKNNEKETISPIFYYTRICTMNRKKITLSR